MNDLQKKPPSYRFDDLGIISKKLQPYFFKRDLVTGKMAFSHADHAAAVDKAAKRIVRIKGSASKYTPHQGKRECARRLRQC